MASLDFCSFRAMQLVKSLRFNTSIRVAILALRPWTLSVSPLLLPVKV